MKNTAETQTSRINSLIRRLASITPKAAALAIVAVVLFAASPMAFAQTCWFSWPGGSTILVTPGESFGPAGTLTVPSLPTGWYYSAWSLSGDFTVRQLNMQVGYFGTWVPQSYYPFFLSGPVINANVTFSALVPSTATNGQTAQLKMGFYDSAFRLLCQTTVTVQVVTSPRPQHRDEHNRRQHRSRRVLQGNGFTCLSTLLELGLAIHRFNGYDRCSKRRLPQHRRKPGRPSLNNRSEVFYLDSSGNVEELYNVGTAWNVTNLTNLIRVQPAGVGSPLVSLVNPYAGTIQLDYVDSAGHIHESGGNRTKWYGDDLTLGAGAPPAAANSSLVTEVNRVANTVEIYFLGTDKHVRELWFSPLTWQWYSSDPTAAAGAPNAANGSALVSLSNPIANTVQVDYLDSAGHIHELWWNGTWHTDDLTAATVSDCRDGFVTGHRGEHLIQPEHCGAVLHCQQPDRPRAVV